MNAARWVNVVAGSWLFVSAWLMPAPQVQRVVQALLGMLIFLVAIVAMADSRFRWLNTLLALSMVVSPFVLSAAATAAAENRVVAGLVVLGASLWPGPRHAEHGHPVHR